MTNRDYTPEYLESLRKEYLRNAADIERLTIMQDGIKARMLEAHDAGVELPENVSYRAGSGRISNSKLATAYPVAEYPHLYKPALDNSAIKNHIAPADLEQYKTYGDATVTIKG